MLNQTDKFPYLETNILTEYSDILESLYDRVKPSPICWLAYEQLEEIFSGNKITDDLSFNIDNGKIVFVTLGSSQPIASIFFDQQYIAFDTLKTNEEPPVENESVRHNRKPIKYSFEYFKRKLTGAKLL